MRKPSLPVYVALGVGFHGLVYSVLALVAARRDRRIGWQRDRPGPINRVGLLLVGAGTMFLAWAVIGHYRAAPGDARPSASPEYLATGAAYGISRNPLYVGGMTMWFGWATFLGSRRAAVAGVAWVAGLAGIAVPYEERMLARTFGDTYTAYRQRVRRWL